MRSSPLAAVPAFVLGFKPRMSHESKHGRSPLQSIECTRSTLALSVHRISTRPLRLSMPDNDLSMSSNPVKATTVSIAIDPVALINTECITVTSAMRKHTRWAHSSVSAILGGGGTSSRRHEVSRPSTPRDGRIVQQTKSSQAVGAYSSISGEDESLANRWGLRGKKGRSMQDNPLMSAFARLRNDLRGCTGQSGRQLKRF